MKAILIIVCIAVASCVTTKEITKTKAITFEVPCVAPINLQIDLPDEEATEDQLTEIHAINYQKFEESILLWKKYQECIDRHNEGLKKLEQNINN